MPTREMTIRSARVARDRLETLTYVEASLVAGVAAANEPTRRIAASAPRALRERANRRESPVSIA